MGETTEKLADAEIYGGPLGALRPSNWLTNEDLLPGVDTIVQIRDTVRRAEVDFVSEKKKGYGSLRFIGLDKELGLNATHINTLKLMFPESEANSRALWGKYIALFIDDAISFKGKFVKGIRIRPGRRDQAELAAAKAAQDRANGNGHGNGGS